jgi:hypothetical protein
MTDKTPATEAGLALTMKSWYADGHGVVVLLSDATDALAQARAEALDVEVLEHEATEGERSRVRREVVEMWAQRGAGYVSMDARADILAILTETERSKEITESQEP